MTITATVIADSISPAGHRLTTMNLRYPRFIHAEFMTHRVFSRNASSSRAVPVERMIQDVIDDCAMPVTWGSNKPGMQAGEEMHPQAVANGKAAWLAARDEAVKQATMIAQIGFHKQIVNRLLEPFGHISVIVTATDWGNFFSLRCHPDAEPTMRALAEAMRDAMNGSAPESLETGDWHLPYVTDKEIIVGDRHSARLAMISAARCARVSYLNHDGSNPDIKKDLALAQRLLESRHASPFEHQARVTGGEGTALWGNLVGWDQFRKMLE